MVIKSVQVTTIEGMYKIAPEEGAPFFLRPEYLISVSFDDFYAGKIFSETETDEILDAGLASAVEFKACEYLARAEQCRFKLSQKLIAKDFEKKYVDMCLTYLESCGYLSDERYAKSWLNTRKINHYEGYSKLLSELLSRGINKETAANALKEFFEYNDEIEICKKAKEKLIRKGKTDEKLITALLNAGFSYKIIKVVGEEV